MKVKYYIHLKSIYIKKIDSNLHHTFCITKFKKKYIVISVDLNWANFDTLISVLEQRYGNVCIVS